MSASRRQTRSQGARPPDEDPNQNESDTTERNESDAEPARGRRTPQQQRRARSNQRRRPQEREPEDFNFMPQHANPGGNQNEPDAGNNENMDPNQQNQAPDQQNPVQQPDANQQQGNANQQQPNAGNQQQPDPVQRQQQQAPPQGQQQQQVPPPDPTTEALARLLNMLRQYPHYAQALDPVTGRLVFPRLTETPMRPLDVAQEHPMDYTTPQTIKFYNKGIEKLAGDAFDGTLLFTWLIKVQDKALMMAWIGILTIGDKLLTTNFSEITMESVRAHAQLIHEEGGRAAQNSIMLLTCLKNSITTTVYTKVYLQKPRYVITIVKQPKNLVIEDGICFLKVVIDSYHSNTRSSTVSVRKQIAHLDAYMRDVAKGDISNLCAHTRSLLYELNAAGETTQDLVTNLISAMQRAPDGDFQRWFSNQVDLWSVRKKDWKEDGSDLMEEAELFYKEAKQTHKWGKKANNIEAMYAFQATTEDDEPKEERRLRPYKEQHSELAALTAQLKTFNNNSKWDNWDKDKDNGGKYDDQKYKWKLKPPRDGESTSKMVQVEGKNKKYHWCDYHKSWTIHSPKECKRQPVGKRGKKNPRKTNRFSKRKAYMDVKAAIAALAQEISMEDDSNTSASDEDDNSNTSNTVNGKNYSDEEEGSDSS